MQAASSAGEARGFDPLIAAVPALVGVAAGILAVRLYAVPLRARGVVRSRPAWPGPDARRAARDGGRGVVRRAAGAAGHGHGRVASRSPPWTTSIAARTSRPGRGRRRLPDPVAELGSLPTALDVARASRRRGRRRASSRRRSRSACTDRRRCSRPSRPDRSSAALAGTPADPRVPRRVHDARAGPDPGDRVPGRGRGAAGREGWATCSRCRSRGTRSSTGSSRSGTRSPACRWTACGWSSRASGSRRRRPRPGSLPVRRHRPRPGRRSGRDPRRRRRGAPRASRSASQAEMATALRSSPVTSAVRTGILGRGARDGRLRRARHRRRARAGRRRPRPGGRAPADARPHRATGARRWWSPSTVRRRSPRSSPAARWGSACSSCSAAGARAGRPRRVAGERAGLVEAGPLLLIFAAMIVVVAVGLLLGATLQRRVAPSAVLRGRFE